jgi:hypothetical protein
MKITLIRNMWVKYNKDICSGYVIMRREGLTFIYTDIAHIYTCNSNNNNKL